MHLEVKDLLIRLLKNTYLDDFVRENITKPNNNSGKTFVSMDMKRGIVLLGIAILFLGACKKSQTKEITSDILVSIETNANNEVIVNARAEELDCTNYELMYDLEKEDDEILLEFTGVFISDICLTALDYVECTVNLGVLSASETTPIIFKSQGIENKAEIGFDTEFTLTMLEELSVRKK